MAIKRYAGDKFAGLSTDAKPGGVLIGATFYETDTAKVFVYDGTSWKGTTIGGLHPVATSGDYFELDNLPDLSALAEIVYEDELGDFPVSGEANKIYIAKDTGKIYRWTGSVYKELSDGVTNTSLTFNDGGSGAASGASFDGSIARTISYNTIGAASALHNHSATDITSGTLPVTRGGTGAGTLTGVLVGNGTGAVTGKTGTANQLLRRNSGNNDYEFWTPNFLTGNQSITLSGNVTGSGTTSITTTIANKAVTHERYQDINTGRILGRVSSGSGVTEELTATEIRTLINVEDGAEANVATNISQGTRTSTTVPINSSTGTGATLSAATTSLAGVMTAADKDKLDGISAGANAYVLSTATSSVLGGVKLGSNTVQSVAANAVTSTASRTYSVQLNSLEQLVVNIPWTDSHSSAGYIKKVEDDSTPKLAANLDANSKKITGLANGTNANDAVNLSQLQGAIASGVVLAGTGGAVQFNDGSNDFAASGLFNYSSANNELSVPDLRITESGKSNTAINDNEAVLKVVTGGGNSTFLADFGNEEIIIASFAAPEP